MIILHVNDGEFEEENINGLDIFEVQGTAVTPALNGLYAQVINGDVKLIPNIGGRKDMIVVYDGLVDGEEVLYQTSMWDVGHPTDSLMFKFMGDRWWLLGRIS